MVGQDLGIVGDILKVAEDLVGQIVLLQQFMPVRNRMLSKFLIKNVGQFRFVFIVRIHSTKPGILRDFRKADHLTEFGEAAVINNRQIEPLAVRALVGITASVAAVIAVPGQLAAVEAVQYAGAANEGG